MNVGHTLHRPCWAAARQWVARASAATSFPEARVAGWTRLKKSKIGLRLTWHPEYWQSSTWRAKLAIGHRATLQHLIGFRAANALLSGPEDSPEQSGGLLDRRVAAWAEPGQFDRATRRSSR
jgi:hypothetical protein